MSLTTTFRQSGSGPPIPRLATRVIICAVFFKVTPYTRLIPCKEIRSPVTGLVSAKALSVGCTGKTRALASNLHSQHGYEVTNV